VKDAPWFVGMYQPLTTSQAHERELIKARQEMIAQPIVDHQGIGLPCAQSRTFTREEVLTVLRALKADTGVVAGREALDKAVRVFERME
jgi:hypothetical protein